MDIQADTAPGAPSPEAAAGEATAPASPTAGLDPVIALEAGRPGEARSRITNLIVLGVVAALIIVVAFVSNQPAAGTSADGAVTDVNLTGTATGEAPTVGKTAPEIVAKTTDGTQLRLSDLKGKPVWLTFGASWCQPCRAENPDIQAAYARFKDKGLVVVQVFMAEDSSAVTDYAGRVGLTYSKIPDPGEQLATEYRILGIPTHYFIDKTGVLRQMRIGSLDPAGIEQALSGIMG